MKQLPDIQEQLKVFQVSYFNNILNPSIKRITDINKVFDFIHRQPPQKLQELTRKIREAQNQQAYEEKARLKKQLPAITASGLFQGGRKKEHFVRHSGLMQLDIDHETLQDFNEKYPDSSLKSILEADEYVFALWESPSGALKGLVKVLPDNEQHKRSFLAVERYFKDSYDLAIDQSCKDLTRLLFLSYTDYLHVNENANVFKPLPEQKQKRPVKKADYRLNGKDYGAMAIARAVDMVSKAAQGEKHYKLRDASYLLGGYVAGGYIDENKARQELRQAIDQKASVNSYAEAYKTIDKALEAGMAKPITVSDWQNKARENFEDRKKQNDREQKQKGKPEGIAKGKAESNSLKEDDVLSPVPDSENPDEFEAVHQFFIENGCYYRKQRTRQQTEIDVQVSDFVMKFLYKFEDGSNNVKRLIQLQTPKGIKAIEVMTGSLISMQKFQETVSSHGGTVYDDNSKTWAYIRAYLMQAEEDAIYVDRKGYLSDYDTYVFSNAIITKNNEVRYANSFGVVSDGEKTFYLPEASRLQQQTDTGMERSMFEYRQGNMHFREYFALMQQAYGIKGLVGTIYGVLALFRNTIFRQLGFFPILYLFGKAGSGKTTFATLIQGLWGVAQKGIPVDSTTKGLARKFSQNINALKYAKEYNEKAAKNQSLIALFKNLYDGDSYSSAVKSTDNKTKDYPVEQGILVDGNFLPNQEHALLTRMIILDFAKSTFDDDSGDALEKLEAEADKGFGQIILELFRLRNEFASYLKANFKAFYNQTKANRGKENEVLTRLQKHIALMVTAFAFLEEHAGLVYDGEKVYRKLNEYIDEQSEMLNNIKPETVFWQAMEYVINNPGYTPKEKLAHGAHYLIDNKKQTVMVKLKEVYPHYVQYCKNNNIEPQEKETLRKALTSEGYKPFRKGSNGSKQTTNYRLGKCYAFQATIKENERAIHLSIEKAEISLSRKKVNASDEEFAWEMN